MDRLIIISFGYDRIDEAILNVIAQQPTILRAVVLIRERAATTAFITRGQLVQQLRPRVVGRKLQAVRHAFLKLVVQSVIGRSAHRLRVNRHITELREGTQRWHVAGRDFALVPTDSS